MMQGQHTERSDEFSFGPFRICLSGRLLERDARRVALGSRAFDILALLLETPGEVVSKQTLMQRVWSNLTVDEGSIRFHIAELRKALGDGLEGARYIINVPGRGYCFVAQTLRQPTQPPPAPFAPPAEIKTKRDPLPAILARMVGREQEIQSIAEKLAGARFVTIVGPGGIGKTTVAVAVGHQLRGTFGGCVYFIDLAQLNDPLLVPAALASSFGLSVQSDDLLPNLITFLSDHACLIILDSSEHLIDAVAALVEPIFREAPHLHILATSRESLQVEGEHVYRLYPLDTPSADPDLSAAEALRFPAVQLFVDCVAAGISDFTLSDADAPTVAEICRKLDGIALAIELAASRVEAYGIEGTAALLDDNFRLLWRGRRTALPRHRTLGAVLDWSYNLLDDAERMILRRLSVFVGPFTLPAAQAVVSEAPAEQLKMIDALADLVAKSLIAVVSAGKSARYRLLDTTRAYVTLKLAESGEAEATAAQHARYYLSFFTAANAHSVEGRNGAWLSNYAAHIGNVRAALEWCFSEHGDLCLGTALAAAATPLFLRMSLLTECHRWAERAIENLDDITRGTPRELELKAALGQSIMFTKGGEAAFAALEAGYRLAEQLNLPGQKLRLMDGMRVFHVRHGAFTEALAIAKRGAQIINDESDPVARTTMDWMLANSHHLVGAQPLARTHCAASLASLPVSHSQDIVYFGYDLRIASLCNLARILWLQGEVGDALAFAKQGIAEAHFIGHSFTLCIALIWAIPVFLWSGEWADAEENIEILLSHARKYSLGPYNAVALGLKGELLGKRDASHAGVECLAQAVETLTGRPYQNLKTIFAASLAEQLAGFGHFERALRTIDQASADDDARSNSFYTAEVLRTKADILTAIGGQDAQAGTLLQRSIEFAQGQGALGWELRSTMSLARRHIAQGDADTARDLLTKIRARFPPDTQDLDFDAAWDLQAALK
jgi:predicted ATPase/DNA-binding winged helix-turn-helix (wHTH) protein